MSIVLKALGFARRAGVWRTSLAVFNWCAWQWSRFVLGVRYREKRIHDYRMVLDLEDPGISCELFVRGDREEEHRYILARVLKPGLTVFDLGANIGYYSVMMARLVGPEGKVYAVEPAVENYSLLNINVRLNGLEGIVETFNLGISNKVGTERFYRSEYANRHTFYPLEHTTTEGQALMPEPPREVAVTTIGAFAAGKRPIDLIRMDIEGYEVEVLEGLIPELKDDAFRAKILFETHRPRYHDQLHDMRSVLRGLVKHGYSVELLVAECFFEKRAYEAYRARGYSDESIIAVFRLCDRAVYRDVADEDAIELICDTDLVRAVLLARKP